MDTIDFCIKRLRELERQIYHARSKGDNLFKLDRSAFLSFDTIAAAHSVAKKLESLSFQRLVTQEPCVKLCPQVDNISWEHIGWAPAKRRVHSSLGLLIILGIIIGWTFLTAFVVGLSQISNLKKVFPNIDPRQPFVEFVVSLLSPVLTALLNSVLLPIILYAFTKFQGIRSESGTNKSVLVKYFSFLLYSIIFTTASVIGGTAVIFNSLTADSATGSALIATGFTLLSPFWISYIAAGYAAYSLELAQAWPLITNFINRRFFKNTPRRRFELNQAPELWYSVCYGSLLFTFTIGALYSLAAPLITPFVLFSFIVAYFVFKYQVS